MKTLKNFYDKYKKIFSKNNFQKSIRKEKAKLYVQNVGSVKYKSKRNKFKILKSKLEFDNTFGEIKKAHIYYYLMGFFLICSSLYVLFFSHYFSIKNIDILREDDLINIDLSYRSIDKFRYKPILFTDKNEVISSIIAHQPNIQEVYVRKILPDNLKIILKSYESMFGMNYENKFYEITSNGVVVPSKEKENIEMIQVYGLSNIGIINYKEIFKPLYIKKIKNILNLIQENSSFVSINEVIYYYKEAELHILDKNGTRIIFDLNKEENIQIEKLNIFNKNYLSKINFGIIYLDLRINERVIYCSKENEFDCNQNIKLLYEEPVPLSQ